MEPSNWQTELSTIRERNEYAFNKSLFCDVEFSVADTNGVKVTIPANKYVLALSSPVFEAMFYGQFTESHKSTVDLPDCTKEALHELLRYVYSDEVNLTGNNVMEVLYLADKYMMPFLVKACKKYLEDEVGPDDVMSVLPHVQKLGDETLQNHLWDIVDHETHKTVSSKSFLNTSREMLCEILVRDTLNIKELDLFRAVDRWADERIKEQDLESNGQTKRSTLGEEVIRLIRFPLMEDKEFAEAVLPCGILKKHEIIVLVQNFHNVSSVTNMFSKKKRYAGRRVLIPSVRFDEIASNEWDYDGSTKDAIDFKVNKPIDLVGVRMFGSEGSTYFVKSLTIYQDDGDYIISELSSSTFVESENMDDGLYYGFTVNLDKPIRLEPGVCYAVEASISGPPSESGINDGKVGKKRKVKFENGMKITYSTSSPPNNGTTVSCGQFPTLILQTVYDSQAAE